MTGLMAAPADGRTDGKGRASEANVPIRTYNVRMRAPKNRKRGSDKLDSRSTSELAGKLVSGRDAFQAQTKHPFASLVLT